MITILRIDGLEGGAATGGEPGSINSPAGEYY